MVEAVAAALYALGAAQTAGMYLVMSERNRYPTAYVVLVSLLWPLEVLVTMAVALAMWVSDRVP